MQTTVLKCEPLWTMQNLVPVTDAIAIIKSTVKYNWDRYLIYDIPAIALRSVDFPD